MKDPPRDSSRTYVVEGKEFARKVSPTTSDNFQTTRLRIELIDLEQSHCIQTEEHYTDTAGFTDHVFALCQLLEFRFTPRIRNVGDTRLFTVEKPGIYTTLAPLVGGSVNSKQILAHWDEIPRIATFIEHGSVTVCRTKPALGNSMHNLPRLLHQHK